MADETETFTVNIVTNASQTLTELEKLRAEIDAYKVKIKEAAAQSNESFKNIAEAIKRAAKAQKEAMLESLKTSTPQELGLGNISVSDAILAIQQQYKSNTTSLTRAVQELNKEQAVADVIAKKFGGDGAQAALTYRQSVDKLKEAIKQVAVQSKVSYKDAAQGLINAGTPVKQTTQALNELTPATQKAAGGLATLGTVGKFVFGAVLGITAVGALRDVVRWFGEAARAGLEFAKAIYQLEIGVRALQRAGVEVTIKDFYENIDTLRDKFKIFTTKEMVVGSAAFANLIRDLGLTKDQIFGLQDAVATLAVVNGRAMDDVQRTVALALSSGYTEGLQRLGISINRVTIAEKAAELGWNKGYTALTEQQRAYATYLLILEKTALYQDDLAKYYETTPGKIETATKAIEEQKNAIGEKLAPAWAFLLTILSKVIDQVGGRLDKWYEGQIGWLAILSSALLKAAATAIIWWKAISGEGYSKDEIKKMYEDLDWENINESLRKKMGLEGPAENQSLGDIEGAGSLDKAKQEQEKMKAFMAEFNEIVRQEQEKLDEETSEAWKEYWEDIADINRDGIRKQVELWRDYSDRLKDIARDMQRAIDEENRDYAIDLGKIDTDQARDTAEAYRDYNRDLADIDRDAANRKSKAERDYRNRELTEEAKFQEKMLQLREDFLFDLEDAVRARDAGQIMRLIRQYNKERQQATREHELGKKDRKQEFAEELADIERERQIKKQERAIELQEKLADIARDAAYERQERAIQHQQELEDIRVAAEEKRKEAAEKYKQEQEDLKIELDRKRDDRKRELDQEILDLKAATQDRINELATALASEYDMTAEMLATIRNEYALLYGPGGYLEAYVLYALSLLSMLPGASNPKLNEPDASLPTAPYSSPGSQKKIQGYAKGGTILATKPTVAMFGEEEPEFVTITPLSKMGKDANQMLSGIPGTMLGQTGGKVEVALWLSPDLESRIIDRTLNETAKVIVSVNKLKVQKGL